ncbi:formyltetrahydrofolate deformylase [Hydrogenimonas sp. SS33]|uniref:formyltetrahydrofolate deformylase n=1 Tax=Hydrogenimonas leucolamina TaxID=2954236 RepID=UPI00336C3072
MTRHYRVLIDCKDEKGLVYKISKAFYDFDLNVEKNREFVDAQNGKFFMRSEVSGRFDPAALEAELKLVLPEKAKIRLAEPRPKRIVLMATKESHCLGDILIRHEAGELEADVVGVVSNYDTLRSLVERFDIPYVHVPHEGLQRAQHEEKILEALERFGPLDYIVLAKYMRILTPEFVAHFDERIINIHHSFLPAFIGANPYKQAYDRGVKIIGATAHFVNNNLDEGPIIAQDTIPVNHAMDWVQMRNAGRDVEKIVLAKALKLALEDRIFVYANKTVIFD